jgi:uncharacterized protein with HEPN domain
MTSSHAKNWQLYANHILDSMAKIDTIRSRGDITEDSIFYDATLRNLKTLSEATQRLPEELKATVLHVPWRQISGFRNILVHEYLGTLDPLTIEAVITQHLPSLKQAIEEMLSLANHMANEQDA